MSTTLPKTVSNANEELNRLNSEILQKRRDFSSLTVQGDHIITEAQNKADQITAEATRLEKSVGELRIEEVRLTQKVADLHDHAERTEREVSDKIAAQRTREQELENRETAVKNRERRQKAQIRRNML